MTDQTNTNVNDQVTGDQVDSQDKDMEVEEVPQVDLPKDMPTGS